MIQLHKGLLGGCFNARLVMTSIDVGCAGLFIDAVGSDLGHDVVGLQESSRQTLLLESSSNATLIVVL